MTRVSPVLAELVVELHRLGKHDRNFILGRISEPERKLILAQLARIKVRPEPSFDALANLSPWLAESLAAARNGEPRLTAAAREALLDAERLLPTKPRPRIPLARRIFAKKAPA